MFTVLTVVYGFIILISYFGDYKTKEIEKQKEEWERVIGKKYGSRWSRTIKNDKRWRNKRTDKKYIVCLLKECVNT